MDGWATDRLRMNCGWATHGSQIGHRLISDWIRIDYGLDVGLTWTGYGFGGISFTTCLLFSRCTLFSFVLSFLILSYYLIKPFIGCVCVLYSLRSFLWESGTALGLE